MITTTPETVFKRGDESLSFADLQVGNSVQVLGLRTTEGVTAKEVNVEAMQEANKMVDVDSRPIQEAVDFLRGIVAAQSTK